MKIGRFLFRSVTTKQTVLKNTFWLLAGQLASRAIKAIIVIYAARTLGASQYGVFALAMSIVPLFMMFADIGVNPVISREIAKDFDNRARWVATGFSAKMALLVLSFVVTMLFAPHLTKLPGMRVLLLVVALAFFLDGIRDFGCAVVRALEEMQWEAIVSVAGSATTVIAALLFLSVSVSALHLALAYLVGSAVGSLAIFIPLRRFLVGLVRNFDLPLARLMLRVVWPYAIWAMLNSVLVYADSIMLGFLKDARAVGIYNAASKPIQLLSVLAELMAASAFPIFARRAVQGDFLTPLSKSLRAVMLTAFPLTFGGIILGRPIITLLYGSPYQESALVFQILLLLIPLQFSATIVANAIFARDRHFELLRYAAVGTIANVVLNWVLIPPYGAAGSAVAMLLSRGMAIVGVLTLLRRIQPVPVLELVWRGMSATLIMAVGVGAAAHAGMNLWVSISLGVVLYLFALRAFKEPLLMEVGELLK
jgi:O-antigen/teichoic acid export membrane protein